jgi:hypothetical protein
MATILGGLRKRVFTPPAADVTFAVRGFDTTEAPARERLERSALQFLVGFEHGIEQPDHDALVLRLETLEQEYQGFAYEGAAMALALRDAVSPHSGHANVQTFLAGPDFDDGPGSGHIFMAYLGVGFALARLPRPLWRRALPDPTRLADHPTLHWLIMDGYGFHQAFFDHRTWVDAQHVGGYGFAGSTVAYTNRIIDTGIGRAMWFVYGGNVDRLLAAVDGFAPDRRADLLSGVGVAASYAGGVPVEDLEALLKGAGVHRPELAQGAVFALRARQVAGLVTDHNELAAGVFCDLTAHEAAMIAEEAIVDLPPDGAVPAFEVFRTRIQDRFRGLRAAGRHWRSPGR